MVSYEGDRGGGGGFPWGLRSEERGRKGVGKGWFKESWTFTTALKPFIETRREQCDLILKRSGLSTCSAYTFKCPTSTTRPCLPNATEPGTCADVCLVISFVFASALIHPA